MIGRSIKLELDFPYAGRGMALAKCLEKGVRREDLTELARCLQAQTLFSLLYLVDGPAYTEAGLDELNWGLFQVDSDGQPFGPQISSLYEYVLDFDPTGREMRPKKNPSIP